MAAANPTGKRIIIPRDPGTRDLYPLRGERNVKSLRAVGATGDWGPAIQSWHDSSSRGEALFLPPGFFEVNDVNLVKGAKIRGVGYDFQPRTTFGNALWLDNAQFGGTIIRCAATSGAAISLVYERGKLDMEDLALIGPGTGTISGLQLGAIGAAALQAHLRNVLVANFKIGYDLTYVEDSSFYDLRSIGNDTGLRFDYACNQNKFSNTEVQYSTGDAVLFVSKGGCTNNTFVGGLLQNIFGRDGLRIEDSNIGNRFIDWYCERFLGTGRGINIMAGAIGTKWEGGWHNPNFGTIYIDGLRTRFADGESNGSPTIAIGASANGTRILGSEQFTVSDLGVNTQRWGGYGVRVGRNPAKINSISHGGATLDFGSIAAGASAELTITVPGAQASGSVAQVSPVGAPEAGLAWGGRVTANGQVAVRLTNPTAAAIDPASRRWEALVTNLTPMLPTDGLLAYYDFTENTGQVLTDRSGNGLHGQLGGTAGSDTNDPAWGVKGLTFDGTTDYVNLDTLHVHNNGTNACAVVLVINGPPRSDRRVWAEGNAGNSQPTVSIGSDPTLNNRCRVFVRNTAGATLLAYDSTLPAFDNADHSIVWTESAGVWALYIDGSLDGAGSYARPTMTLDKTTIGALGRSTYGSYTEGRASWAGFYNRAPDADEVRQLHTFLRADMAARGVILP